MKRPSLWNRLALSVVVGATLALVLRAVRDRRLAQAPRVPAPSTEWPPLPDLAAPRTATTPPARTTPASPVVTGSPIATTPTTTTAPAPPDATVSPPMAPVVISPPDPDPDPDPDRGPDPSPITVPAVTTDEPTPPAVRVPGDGPGGAAGTLVTDPEPEAVLPDERIDRARDERPVVSRGVEGDVPPAPEPTFGTAPDAAAAAEAPVPVATPVEPGPEEVLEVPQRATPERPPEGG